MRASCTAGSENDSMDSSDEGGVDNDDLTGADSKSTRVCETLLCLHYRYLAQLLTIARQRNRIVEFATACVSQAVSTANDEVACVPEHHEARVDFTSF